MSEVDHKVDFRAQETLMAIAMRERERAGIDHLHAFKARSLIESYIGQEFQGRGKLKLATFSENQEPYVKLNPFGLHINHKVWHNAGRNDADPLTSFKLLHELAHILLHRHPKSSFSRSQNSNIEYAQDEESAEWQANVFAAFSMAPPYLAIECKNRGSLLRTFNYPEDFVDFWFDLRQRRPLKFFPDYCVKCGMQPLAIVGSRFRCTNCGHISK